MAHTVVLHIGAMKSGTSTIQHQLQYHHEALAEQGFCFPGRRWRQQILGVLDVLDQKRDGQIVPGLYAVGEAAGFGGGGVHGYRALEGTFLGGCLFSGRNAGRAAAKAVV